MVTMIIASVVVMLLAVAVIWYRVERGSRSDHYARRLRRRLRRARHQRRDRRRRSGDCVAGLPCRAGGEREGTSVMGGGGRRMSCWRQLPRRTSAKVAPGFAIVGTREHAVGKPFEFTAQGLAYDGRTQSRPPEARKQSAREVGCSSSASDRASRVTARRSALTLSRCGPGTGPARRDSRIGAARSTNASGVQRRTSERRR